ncbi:MAG: threonine synthase [Methanococcaceae archaeon]
MKYLSTKNTAIEVPFREAVLKGLASDGGLFFPRNIPKLSDEFFTSLKYKELSDIAFEISSMFIDDIPPAILKDIIKVAVNFPAPVKKLSENISILELFHGNTLAFKDFGARFLAGILEFYMKEMNRKCTILVATSGDTGSAVASGFHGRENIDVIILYPSGKVSRIQEQQLTTFGDNIFAFEIEGNFDDCQHLVKTAFMDDELNRNHFLSSANSINIGRLLPQTFYYFNAFKDFDRQDQKLIFAVPSGNLGNLTSGLFAKEMGLPVDHFVSALNINDTCLRFIRTGIFSPTPSVPTISNAMDVGNPSNLERIRFMYQDNIAVIGRNIHPYSFSDTSTRQAIEAAYNQYGYIFDPHGAVGYLAAMEDQKKSGASAYYIILETAHPAKFINEINLSSRIKIETPPRLLEFLKKEKKAIVVQKDYTRFKTELTKLLLARDTTI